MRRLPIGALFAVLCAGFGHPAAADSLFGAQGLSAKWCETKAVRQTVVYIDDTSLYDGVTDWATKLVAKLKATLAPGERVTVVRLQPATGQSHEEWTGCWPALTPELAQSSSGLMSFFVATPESEVADQQTYFLAVMGSKLTQIYNAAKRRPAKIDRGDPPQKQIVRALASDDGRFSNSLIPVRAIIFSDMAENSDLGSAYQGAPASTINYGARLGSYLRNGVFYGFGMGADIANDPRFGENARAFWQAALRTMSASLAGLGADLNVPNILPTRAYNFNVSLSFQDQELTGRMTLLAGADGNLVDSILTIQRLGSAGLTGMFTCESGDAGACALTAQTTTGIATSAPSEDVVLRGRGNALSGKLGVRGQGMEFAIKTGGPS